MKDAGLIRIIMKNYSFTTALQQYRINTESLCDCILILLQLCHATFIINNEESEYLLSSYVTDDERQLINPIFQDRLISIPNDPHLLTLIKKNNIIKHEFVKKDYDVRDAILKQKELNKCLTSIPFSKDFLCELFQLQKLTKMVYRYSKSYIDIASVLNNAIWNTILIL